MRRHLPLILSVLALVALTATAAPRQARPAGSMPSNLVPLWRAIHHSYMWIFQNAGRQDYSAARFQQMNQYLLNSRDQCVKHFQGQIHEQDVSIHSTENYLQKNTATITTHHRHLLHCRIQNSRYARIEATVMAQHALPIAYENYRAKLQLLENWPAQRKQLEAELRAGTFHDSPWGNVQDIGRRTIIPGQYKDIKMGKKATQELFSRHLLPPLVKDPKLVKYVTTVADRVAAHSDLKVPLHVYVLDSKTINAFSIGGGYLFVYRGLLGAVQDEDELAGVLGHEIAHIVCRHSERKMKQAEIADILMEAAEVAGMALTGGIASIGEYYGLQYGYQGLGMLISLRLLGISRQYELQADHLGIQYAWNSGYNPDGFIRFFSWMANKVGYVNSMDWFYDHPPFYERMVKSEEEIMYLPKRPNEVVTTSAFLAMKKELALYMANRKRQELKFPSTIVLEPGCGAPPKHNYKPGQLLETLCATANNPGQVVQKTTSSSR